MTPSLRRLLRWSAALIPVGCLAFGGLSWQQRATAAAAVDELHDDVDSLIDELDRMPAPTAPAVERRPSRVPAAPDVVGTLRELEALGAEQAAGLTDARALPSEAPGSLLFRIAGTSTARGVCGLLGAIENDKRLMIVQDGVLTAVAGGRVDYEFRLATYHHVTEGR